LVMLSMIGIFGILVGIKCSHILNSRLILPSEGDKTFILPSEGVADCISLSSEGDDTASYTSEILNVFMVSHLHLQTATQKS
jgi:hypothetical protein